MLRQSQNLLGIGFILALFIVDGFILVEEKGDPDNMVWLDGGRFTMGSDHGLPDEAPARPVSVCLLYTSPSPRDQRGSRMPSSA